MKIFFLEAGTNHFGKVKEANKILNFFLNSRFQNLTFMLQTEDFYINNTKKGINFKLSKAFYKEAIKKCHAKKKKIGLAVCSAKTSEVMLELNFDFYKLLSLGINNFKLINLLKTKKKPIYISTGVKTKNHNIVKCLKSFSKKDNLTLLHAPMSYEPDELNFSKINELKDKYKLKVGYSNHNNDINSLNVLSAYKPDAIFVYCKPKRKKGRVYTDHDHAFYFDELEKMLKDYDKYNKMNFKLKEIKKINIFAKDAKI
jgi:sialic acid synthase SpsE